MALASYRSLCLFDPCRNSFTALRYIWTSFKSSPSHDTSFACIWQSCMHHMHHTGSLIQWYPSWFPCRIRLLIPKCYKDLSKWTYSTAWLLYAITKFTYSESISIRMSTTGPLIFMMVLWPYNSYSSFSVWYQNAI